MSTSADTLRMLLQRLNAIKTKYEQDIEKNPHHETIESDVKIPGRGGVEYDESIALYTLCLLVHEAMQAGLDTAERDEFLAEAAKLESSIVLQECHRRDSDGFIHVCCTNIVSEDPEHIHISSQTHKKMIAAITRRYGPGDSDILGNYHANFDPSSRPNEHSTPLARFAASRLPLPADASDELAAFYEARCEVVDGDVDAPVTMAATDDVVVVLGADGWKQLSPTMLIQRLAPISDDTNAALAPKFPSSYSKIGLAGIANQLRLDATRQLAWVGDEDRVKSYKWSYDKGGDNVAFLPAHTLNSKGYAGAMLLRNGATQVFRSGKQGMAMWDVPALPTHGSNGTTIIGTKMKSRSGVEPSEGAAPTTTMSSKHITNLDFAENHPGGGNHILAVSWPSSACSIKTVDLETQQLVMRFLGHSSAINCIATTSGLRTGGLGDPNAFVTACSDGGVRLYDVRQPLPQLAIDHGGETLQCALYEFIGGQPFIIYGGTQSQQIQVWDVRNRAPLYRLATGNNSVTGLVWDAPRQTLVAATECPGRDRLGGVHGYRWAQIGRHGEQWLKQGTDPAEKKDEQEDDSDEYSDDGDNDWEYGWPKNAWHHEKEFGVAYDAGDHRIFRYQFKANADPKVLPEYGSASPENSG